MYDFHFGDKEEILKNPEDFLLFCKRMLPRWINGIPDSECIAIYRTLGLISSDKPVLVETGCGASTLAMFLYAALNDGVVYSWDTNGSKGSFLRSVISEVMCRPLGVDLYKHWCFIGFDSTSEHAGIQVISELGYEADYGYFDSWHTLNHLMTEINSFEMISNNSFIIALDDAYYTCRHNNYSYINMIRKKMQLPAVIEPKSNICNPFYQEIQEYLETNYKNVVKLNDSYKDNYKEDIFFNYFSGDRQAMNKIGMEKSSLLEHRYDCWRITK